MKLLIFGGDGPLHYFSLENFPSEVTFRGSCSLSEDESFISITEMNDTRLALGHYNIQSHERSILSASNDFTLKSAGEIVDYESFLIWKAGLGFVI